MKKSFLVFWDFENVQLTNHVTAKRFLMRLHYLGEVKKAVVFSDWDNFPRFVSETLHAEGAILVHVPDKTPQSVDRVMSNYILDELENRQGSHTYVVVSGDSDLWPIVERIKRKKNQTWIIANSANTSQKMIDAGDEYYDVHTFAEWSGPYARGGMVDQEVLRTAAVVTVHEAIELIEKEGNKAGTGLVKAMTKRLDWLFSEPALGFSNWGEFAKWGQSVKGFEMTGKGDATIMRIPKRVPKRFADFRKMRDNTFSTLVKVVETMLEQGREMGLIWRPDSEEIPIMDDLIIMLRKHDVDYLACGYRSVAHLVSAAHSRHFITNYPTDWRNNEFVLAPRYSTEQLRKWVNDLPDEVLGGAERTTDSKSLWNISFRLHRYVLKSTTDLLQNSEIREKYDAIMRANSSLVLPLHLRLFVCGSLNCGTSCEDIVDALMKYHSSEIDRDELRCPS